MKKFNQFLSESSYVSSMLDSDNNDWGGHAARAIGSYVTKKGKKVSSKTPGTNYETYELDGNRYKVATDSRGIVYTVHRLQEEYDVKDDSDDNALLMKLTRKAMTTGLPGSAARKKATAALNDQRKKMGLKPLKENFTLPDGGYLKRGTKVKWKAADGKEVEGTIDQHQGGRYIDAIKVTKSKSIHYKAGGYADDVSAEDIGLTFATESKKLHTGTTVKFRLNSMPNKVLQGIVDYDDGQSVVDVLYLGPDIRSAGVKDQDIIPVNRKDLVKEEAPANSAGNAIGTNPTDGTSVAGYDPLLKTKPMKRSKFAGKECFEVDGDTFHKCHLGHMKNERWNKYLKDDCPTCKAIHAYSQRHPQKDIVIQKEGSGEMMFLKKKGIHY